MEAGPLVHDDEGVLELAGALGVQPEVGLERDGHLHAPGDVHEGAAGPHRAVERGELVVGGGHQLHKVLAHHVGVLAVERALHVGIDHALSCHLGADVVVHQLGIVLGAHAGQRLALRLGNAQTLKGILDVLRHVFPVVLHFCVGPDVGGDMVHVQPRQRRAPVRQRRLVVNLQGVETELLHPDGVVLLLRQLFHDGGGQACLHAVGIVLRVPDVVYAAVDVVYIGLFAHDGTSVHCC